ncbi:MAG: hypothetical protein ACREH9_06135, partial [Pseudomonadota bacterium]
EPGDGSQREAHLAACESCRVAYQALQRVLNSVDLAPAPQPSEDYETRVWQRLQPQVDRPPARRFNLWSPPRRWEIAGAVAALVVAAFLAGRWQRPSRPAVHTAGTAQLPERVLMVALGDHLERSQMILLELSNAEPKDGRRKAKLDISYEQSAAEDLLEANRLYRQTAQKSGELAAASVLDDLERTLLEIAHSPSSVSPAQLAGLRKQMEDQGILFEVRVFGSRVREREAPPRNAAGNL